LRNVPGVTEINSIGGFAKEYQISPIPERLASLGVTLQDIVTALDRNNGNVGAGYIEKRGEQYLIRAPGQVKTLEDIGNVILSSANGVPMRVRDVAEVGLGRELRTGAATDNGREVVLGTVFMLIGQNSRTVSQAVDKKMVEINRSLPEGVHAVTVYDRTVLGGQSHQHGEEEPAGRRDLGDRDPVPVPGQHPRSHHHGDGDSLVDAVHLHGYGDLQGERQPDEPGSAGLRHHHRRRGGDRRELRTESCPCASAPRSGH
jgi:hypothetical protein